MKSLVAEEGTNLSTPSVAFKDTQIEHQNFNSSALDESNETFGITNNLNVFNEFCSHIISEVQHLSNERRKPITSALCPLSKQLISTGLRGAAISIA
jgi:hypothetical protein